MEHFGQTPWRNHLSLQRLGRLRPRLDTRTSALDLRVSYQARIASLGLSLMFAELSPHKVLAALTGKLWTEAAPIVEHGCADAALAFAKAIEEYARKQALATIVIGSFGGSSSTAPWGQLGFRQTRYWEFVHDLSVSEDAIWESMEYKRRKNIRKAERMGVVLNDRDGRRRNRRASPAPRRLELADRCPWRQEHQPQRQLGCGPDQGIAR